MTKPRATTGPWKFGYTDNLEHPIIMCPNGEIVCIMREGVSTEDGKLLAMAPELLEALKALESAASFAAIDDDVERAAVGAALEYARAVLATSAGDTGNPSSRAQDKMNTTHPEALQYATRLSQMRGGLFSAAAAELHRQYARISELEAARIAYASEFESDADGDPDVGNIHANIRAMKAKLAATLAADTGNPTSTSATVSDEQIKAVFLANGFTIKSGHDDLKPYVYQAARALLAATQPAAQGMDARDAAFEAVRKAFCKLQRYSFFLDGAGNVRRCADHCGNWVEFEAVHTLFEPQSVDAALAAQAKKGV